MKNRFVCEGCGENCWDKFGNYGGYCTPCSEENEESEESEVRSND